MNITKLKLNITIAKNELFTTKITNKKHLRCMVHEMHNLNAI